jgi:transposase
VVVNKTTKQIICTHTGPGRKHDRKLFTCSRVRFRETSEVIADSGYQGLRNEHANTSLPTKKSKKKPLTREQKLANREQSRKRILVENVMGLLKRFKIIADRYRNRRKRFGLRFNLIAAIYNIELASPI